MDDLKRSLALSITWNVARKAATEDTDIVFKEAVLYCPTTLDPPHIRSILALRIIPQMVLVAADGKRMWW
jgi:hypothetical protein